MDYKHQVRERYLSLKKGSANGVLREAEKELCSAKQNFEKDRFALMTALASVESKKKFEFLEAIACTMDAHLRYFRDGITQCYISRHSLMMMLSISLFVTIMAIIVTILSHE
jgi:hypothetical protein